MSNFLPLDEVAADYSNLEIQSSGGSDRSRSPSLLSTSVPAAAPHLLQPERAYMDSSDDEEGDKYKHAHHKKRYSFLVMGKHPVTLIVRGDKYKEHREWYPPLHEVKPGGIYFVTHLIGYEGENCKK